MFTNLSAVAFMGIMHPPSSGLACKFHIATIHTYHVFFTFHSPFTLYKHMIDTFSKNPRWGASNVILILLGDCIIIFCSVLYLNLFSYKQYPTYWIGHNWRRSLCWRSWEELKNKRHERRLFQDLHDDSHATK